MSIKFENRFSPSIIKAASIMDAGNALHAVADTSTFKELAVDSFNRGVSQLSKLLDGSGLEYGAALSQLIDCSKEMQADRRQRAQARKARREQMAAEREQFTFA